MQCKDIPTNPILHFVSEHGGIGCTWFNLDYEERSVIHAMPSGTPQKLVLAKMKQLISKNLIKGCGCGCRGDFEITTKGSEVIR